MPNIGAEGGLAGLFGGISEGAKYINEKRSKSEDLYLTLSQNKSLRQKTGKQFKPGMTRVQVMDLFEENPDKSSAYSSTLASQAYIDATNDLYRRSGIKSPFVNVKEGEITVGELKDATRQAGISINQSMQESRLAQSQKEMRLKLAQTVAEMSDVDRRAFKSDFKTLFDYATGKIDDIDLGTVETEFGSKVKKIKPAWYEKFKDVPIMGDMLKKPGVVSGGGLVDENWDETKYPITDEMIDKIGKTYPDRDISAMSPKDIYNIYQQASQSKVSPLGVTQTPGMEQQIGTALQQPVQQAPVAAPQVAPTTSNLMQKSVLPQQNAGVKDPNQYVLELARQYRDKLANSPYQIN